MVHYCAAHLAFKPRCYYFDCGRDSGDESVAWAMGGSPPQSANSTTAKSELAIRAFDSWMVTIRPVA